MNLKNFLVGSCQDCGKSVTGTLVPCAVGMPESCEESIYRYLCSKCNFEGELGFRGIEHPVITK